MDDERRTTWDPGAFPERRGGDSRRAHPRVPVALSVRGSGRAAAQHAETVDLSVGGLSLLLPEALPPGAQAELTIDVPGSSIPVRAVGEVAGRAVPREDLWEVGVRFISMDPSDARVIEAWLDRVRRSDRP